MRVITRREINGVIIAPRTKTCFASAALNTAPWFVIPADHKWYRDAAVAAIVQQTLTGMDPQMPPVDVDLEQIRALYEREAAEYAKNS